MQNTSPNDIDHPRAVAVYCGSSLGRRQAYVNAATSLGKALAASHRPLVYGGGSKGIMGVVSGAVLRDGGSVTGVIPYAMVQTGGEKEKTVSPLSVDLNEPGREKVETIVVTSMHERKVEMAERVGAFVGLPGGFGTFEEVLEVTTWTQLGIHSKPVVLLNVLSFFSPLHQLIENAITEGYIQPKNRNLIVFVSGPESQEEHETFDWGQAALDAIDKWERDSITPLFNWTVRKDGKDTLVNGLEAI